MADEYTRENTAVLDTDIDNQAYPNTGIDGNNAHDPAKGATIGGVGGAIVGGLAGGPVGAVVGAVAGAAASGAAVAGIDKKDNDNSVGENTEYDPDGDGVIDRNDNLP
jgi:uncharacterized protein YcfJ